MSECPYCQNTFEMQDTCSDEFRMWQGLQGPYYIPTVDEEGVLSWTNTGGLPNPDPVDITGPAGASFSIAGIVETVADLPQSAEGVWLVGEDAPYDGYTYIIDSWEFIGQFAIGPKGEPGAAGASAGFGTPTATVDSSTGTPSVTVTASGPDTAKVFAFAFHNLKGDKGEDGQPGAAGQGVPTGGTAGQVLAKRSGTNYDTEWVDQSGGADPATVAPIMDGTAAVGTSTKYAREDHVHPTDTSRQETLVSGTNIKTINNNSLLGSGDITISGVPSGGTTGQVLKKTSNTDYATGWAEDLTPTMETAQLITSVSFSSIETNKLTRVGNIVAIEFRGTPSSAAGSAWKKILELPQGFYSSSNCALFATSNNTAALAFIYADAGESDRKNVNISVNYTTSGSITISGVYTIAE